MSMATLLKSGTIGARASGSTSGDILVHRRPVKSLDESGPGLLLAQVSSQCESSRAAIY